MSVSAKTLKHLAAIAVVSAGMGSIMAYALNNAPTTVGANRLEDAAANARPLIKVANKSSIHNSTVNSGARSIGLSGQTGKTALEVLRANAAIKTEASSFGEFVTVINGVEADGIQSLWSFYVDGQLAKEDAQSYRTTNGEQLEWRVEPL